MKVPSEQQWEKICGLISRFDQEPRDHLESALGALANQAEDPLILSYVRLNYSLTPAAARFAAGSLIAGRYLLSEKLGEGGMGVVFRARQERTRRDVALKMIHPALVGATLAARFADEIETLAQLTHPNIVQVFDADVHRENQTGAETPFYVMELVEGELLHRRFQHRPAGELEAVELIRLLSLAVQYAHDRNVVHRDLKPGNIIVRPDGTPVILDFGLAQARGRAVEGDETMEAFLPASGTPLYMAPERFLPGARDFEFARRGDVYALGVMLFELLSGRHPHQVGAGASLAAMRAAILDHPPSRLAAVTEAAADLDEILVHALQPRPEDRYSSAAVFARALGRAAIARTADMVPAPAWKPAEGALVPASEWQLVRRLGEGGVGEVWLAEHTGLHERRVIKFCADEAKARSLRRELSLFRILDERLGGNPHFVRLHEASLDEAPLYLMMDYVEALDLRAWVGEQGGFAHVARGTFLDLIAQTAEALQTAHDAGVLHRDVKPANLLIAEAGGAARWHVYLTDFGIGQLVNTEEGSAFRAGFTRTLMGPEAAWYSGTQLYMAPEVLAQRPATARSDLYSLGVVLLQGVVGDFSMPVVVDWERRVDDPLLVEDLRGCLAGDPAERLGSLGEFARRLRDLPERRLESSRREAEACARERAAYRRGVWRTAGLAALVILVIGSLAVVALAKSRAARAATGRAVLARVAAASGEARALLAARTAGRTDHALRALQDAAREAPGVTSELRSLATQLLTEHDYIFRWRRELSEIDSTAGLAVVGRIAAIVTQDGNCLLLPLHSEATKPRALPLHGEGVGRPRRLAFSQSGRLLAVADDEGRFGWWEIGSGAFHLQRERISAFAFGPGESLAFGLRADAERVAEVVVRRCSDNVDLHRLVSRIDPFSRQANALAFNHDSTLLAVSSDFSHQVLVWDLTERRVRCQTYQRAAVSSVAWGGPSTDIERLLSACRDRHVYSWHPEKERFLDLPSARWQGHQWAVEQMVVADDGSVATRDLGGEVILWDGVEGTPATRFPAMSGLAAIAFTADQGLLRQTDAALELWQPRSISMLTKIALPLAGRADFDFSPDGAVVAVATGRDFRLYGSQSGRQLANVPAPLAQSIRFSPDGSLLATYRYGARRWPRREENGKWLFDASHPLIDEVLSGSLELSADGSTALFAAGAKAFLIDLVRAAAPQSFDIGSPARELALDPTGAEFSVSRDDGVVLMGSRTGTIARSNITDPWFSFVRGRWRSGRQPFALAADLEASAEAENVWSLKVGHKELLRSPPAGPRVVERIRFSRDASRLGILWRDGTLEIWCVPLLHAELARLGLGWEASAPPWTPVPEPPAVELIAPPPDQPANAST